MTYFFILPAFLVYLLIFGAMLLVSAFVQPAKPLFAYVWRALLASILGFFVANFSLWVIVLAVAKTLDVTNPSDQIRELLGVPAGLALLLGPIPVSLIGIIAGFVFGVIWAFYVKRKSKRHEQ